MDNCCLTGLPFTDRPYHDDAIASYHIAINDTPYKISVCLNCLRQHIEPQPDFKKYYSIIQSMIANDVFGDLSTKVFHWNAEDIEKQSSSNAIALQNELLSGIYPRSPKEKLDNLLYELYQLQGYGGESVSLNEVGEKGRWQNWYFANPDEFRFYLRALEEQNLISIDAVADFFSTEIRFTYAGLSKYIELFNEGYASNICFIAMAFVPETIPIRQAIKEALITTGYQPLIIDEQNLPSDRTINDEIIAGLRKCKFCIADFSFHRNGVYFEAGFALGQKKPVIYTCLQEEFSKAHFDIKPLQHIIYASPDELRSKLISKIQAWID